MWSQPGSISSRRRLRGWAPWDPGKGSPASPLSCGWRREPGGRKEARRGRKHYNTPARQKELCEPLTPGEVRMYVCGITAYDLSPLGHARSALVFDVIRRYLEFTGTRVRFVRNFTDVDDKIIKRAEKDGVSPAEVSERYITEYQK